MPPRITEEEIRNGWTAEAVAQYRAEREAAVPDHMVPGNVVTEFERPRPPIRIESATSFNPHSYRGRT